MESEPRETVTGEKETNDLGGIHDDCEIVGEETKRETHNVWRTVEYRMTRKRRLAKEREEAEANTEVKIEASTWPKLQKGSGKEIVELSDEDDFDEVSLRKAKESKANYANVARKREDVNSFRIARSNKEIPPIDLPTIEFSTFSKLDGPQTSTGQGAKKSVKKSQADSATPQKTTSGNTSIVNANKTIIMKAVHVDIMDQVPKQVKAIKKKRRNVLSLNGLPKSIDKDKMVKLPSPQKKKSTKRKISPPSKNDDETDYEMMKRSRNNEYPFELPKSSSKDDLSLLPPNRKKSVVGDKYRKNRTSALSGNGLPDSIQEEALDKLTPPLKKTTSASKRRIELPSSTDNKSDCEIAKKSRTNEHPFKLPASSSNDSPSELPHNRKKPDDGDETKMKSFVTAHQNINGWNCQSVVFVSPDFQKYII